MSTLLQEWGLKTGLIHSKNRSQIGKERVLNYHVTNGHAHNVSEDNYCLPTRQTLRHFFQIIAKNKKNYCSIFKKSYSGSIKSINNMLEKGLKKQFCNYCIMKEFPLISLNDLISKTKIMSYVRKSG